MVLRCRADNVKKLTLALANFIISYGKAYDIMKLAKANDDTKTDSSGNSQDFFK